MSWNPEKTEDKGVEWGEFTHSWEMIQYLLFSYDWGFNLLATAVKTPCSASDCGIPAVSPGAGL